MNLPLDKNISVSKLVSVFRSTSATYKFYWFWAILEVVESGKTTITKREIFARMISLSWYTVNYFKVSFGKQDLIQSAVEQIKEFEKSMTSSEKKNLSLEEQEARLRLFLLREQALDEKDKKERLEERRLTRVKEYDEFIIRQNESHIIGFKRKG